MQKSLLSHLIALAATMPTTAASIRTVHLPERPEILYADQKKKYLRHSGKPTGAAQIKRNAKKAKRKR